MRETSYKDGKYDERHGVIVYDETTTRWFENGKIQFEGTFKDGVRDGLQTWWYENRTKKMEGTFKDGNMILSKYWNEDGSLKE
jgi:antitoxin component YwqK of YwqJK toxin-antitoxin module